MSGAVLQFCFVVLVEFLACGLCLVSCDFSGILSNLSKKHLGVLLQTPTIKRATL